jgi:phosphate:Na+ symporter
MQNLLNLLAAITLLVWGKQTVRSVILKVLEQNLREVLQRSSEHRIPALFAGLAVLLGADVGMSLLAVVFSFDLSWLSPILIFGGVFLFTSRKDTTIGQIRRVFIGLGLITLALQLIVSATMPLTQATFTNDWLSTCGLA